MEAITAIPGHSVLMLLMQFGVILLTARVFGELMQRLGQPTVLGELMAGILLGPSFLGLYWPETFAMLFPASALSYHLLEIVSWLGMIFLLFLVGVETDVQALRGLGRPAVWVTLFDLILPFASGIGIGYVLPEHFMGAVGNREVLALFLGIGMSITAIPVLAKILIELGMLRRNFGLTALGAGIAEDLVGWLLLPVMLDLAKRGRVDAGSVVQAVTITALFIVCAWGLGSRIVPFLLQEVDERLRTSYRRVTAAALLAIFGAALTHHIGIHAVFGAFVAGLLVGQSPRFKSQDREVIEGLSYGILTPVFFSFAGLQVRLHEMTDWGFFAVILGTAVVGKVAGAYIGGRIGGFKRIECLAIGIGMNARGSMEVVLALLGLSAGIISQQLFSIIVMMAMITSLMTPPLLRLLAPFIPLGEDELSRMRHEAQEARAMFKKKDLKFLVPTTGGPNGAAILGMVAPLIKSGRAAITLLFVRAPGKSIKEKLIKFFRKDEQSVELQASVERLKELAKERGVAVAPKIVTSSERAEAVLDEARQGCDLLILGAYSPSDPFGGEFLEPVVAGSPAHVAVFRGTAELPKNFRKILLPTKGDALFPAVFEFAAMLAEHDPEASITVLYAATRAGHAKRRWNPLSLLLGAQAEPIDAGDSMAKLVAESIEAHASSTDHKLKVELRSVKGDSAAQAILEEARAGGYDLLLMGATKHLVRERLFFGHTVDEIALQAPCPVVAFTPKGEGVMRA